MTDTPENVKMLNEKLGITSRENLFNSAGVKSIEEMLESSKRDFELLCQNIASKKDEVEEAEQKAKASFDAIKESADGETPTEIAQLESASAVVSDFNSTIESMLDLIDKGNSIIEKLYDVVVSTDIIDPDLINSVAAVIHSVRESNDNLIQFNTQKIAMENQYRLAIDTEKLKQKHRLELEYFKFKLRQEELENKARLKREESAAKDGVDVKLTDNSSTRVWSQSDVAEAIRSM